MDAVPHPLTPPSPGSPRTGARGCRDRQPGDIVHQYELLRVLGQGGMGVVFEALHVRLKRRVALKLLSPKTDNDPDAITRFEREMAVIGQLIHPNIVQALDAGLAGETHYLAMELVDGADVEQVAISHGPLAVDQACEIIRQAAIGLSHAHAQGIIHRDIKPSNLLLSKSGVVKVSDLGLARLQSQAPDSALTAQGTILGTVDYMSPEQADAREPGTASDLYSLGATLFRLLAGRPLFSGSEYDSINRKLAGHLKDPPPRIQDLRQDVPAALDALLQELLAKPPFARPASAVEVSERLAKFSSGTSIKELWIPHKAIIIQFGSTKSLLEGTTASRPARQARPRNRVGTIAGAIAGLVSLLAVAFVFAYWNRRAADSPTPPVPALVATLTNSASNTVPDARQTAILPTAERVRLEYEDLPADQIQPLQWYPLLNRTPHTIVWTQSPLSDLRYDSPLKTCRVTSQDLAVLEMGKLNHQHFTLQMDLYQSRWPGGLGVFFGLRERADNPGGYIAQAFQIQPRLGVDSREYPLLLMRVEMLITKVGSNEYHLDTLHPVSCKLSSPGARSCMLELEVEAGRLRQLRWGGNALTELYSRDVEQPFNQADFSGPFGVYLLQAEATVSDMRVMIRQ